MSRLDGSGPSGDRLLAMSLYFARTRRGFVGVRSCGLRGRTPGSSSPLDGRGELAGRHWPDESKLPIRPTNMLDNKTENMVNGLSESQLSLAFEVPYRLAAGCKTVSRETWDIETLLPLSCNNHCPRRRTYPRMPLSVLRRCVALFHVKHRLPFGPRVRCGDGNSHRSEAPLV